MACQPFFLFMVFLFKTNLGDIPDYLSYDWGTGHQKGSGSTVHPMTFEIRKETMLEVACYLSCRSAFGAGEKTPGVSCRGVLSRSNVGVCWGRLQWPQALPHDSSIITSSSTSFPAWWYFSLISLPYWSQVQSCQRDQSTIWFHFPNLHHSIITMSVPTPHTVAVGLWWTLGVLSNLGYSVICWSMDVTNDYIFTEPFWEDVLWLSRCSSVSVP